MHGVGSFAFILTTGLEEVVMQEVVHNVRIKACMTVWLSSSNEADQVTLQPLLPTSPARRSLKRVASCETSSTNCSHVSTSSPCKLNIYMQRVAFWTTSQGQSVSQLRMKDCSSNWLANLSALHAPWLSGAAEG